jgi:GT2 family glycosyltransferase
MADLDAADLDMPDLDVADLDVVVVAYGAPELLDGCLAPLEGHLRVLVVDNSSDPAVRTVAESYGATYVDPGRNLGFAAGVNLGLSLRLTSADPESDDVLLLNPDASISPGDISKLHDGLHAHADLACVAPAQVDPVTGEAARVAWPFPTPARAWLEALGLGRLGARTGFLIGSVLLLRGAAVSQVGPFDERFFLYAEETDWQRRASDLGWRVALCPGAVATHVGAGTGGEQSERDTHFHASNERYVLKHFGRTGWVLFRSGVMTGALVRGLFLPGERGRRAAARFRLYLTGPSKAESRLAGGRVG